MKPEALMNRVKDQKTAEALAKKANYGLAANTQESYKTAINHLERCEEETACLSHVMKRSGQSRIIR